MNQARDTKNARREAAREAAARQREAGHRRRVRLRAVILVGSIVVVVGIAVAIIVPLAQASNRSATTTGGAGTIWPAPTDVEAAVHSAGLDMLTAEGTALHIHQHLAVTVVGTAVRVPAGIGIDEQAGRISSIHTHDESGIVHVESPTVRDFTLGEVFDEWQVPLGPGRVGAYADGQNGQTVTVFVNQQPYTGDPASIVLADHQDIDIIVARAGDPVSPPAAFDWPQGY